MAGGEVDVIIARIRAVERELNDAAEAGIDAALRRVDGDVAQLGVGAGQRRGQNAATGNGGRNGDQLPRRRVQLLGGQSDVARSTCPGIDVASLGKNGDAPAVVGGDARAVNIHVVLGADGNASAAGRENSFGRVGITVGCEFAANVQSAAGRQHDITQQAVVGDFRRGHIQIAGNADI